MKRRPWSPQGIDRCPNCAHLAPWQRHLPARFIGWVVRHTKPALRARILGDRSRCRVHP